MKSWHKAVEGYLGARRSLGFKLKSHGIRLSDFARFLQRKSARALTVKLALEWARKDGSIQPSTQAQRLGTIRGFARYHCASDPRTQIPPPALLPFRPKRARPYLYTEAQVRNLLAAALRLSPEDTLRRWTYHCLLGLLAVSGMRVGEAMGLRLGDVDLRVGLLTVRGAKFEQSRLVPLHPSTKKALADYRLRRDRYLHGQESSDYFFVSRRGGPLQGSSIRTTFYGLSRQTGLRGPTDSYGPRLHDMRHRFAVETLIGWYRRGQDAERLMPVLSTYLGHVHVADTYWYLTACPELMGLAVNRLEQRWRRSAQ
jgi:integrase/recombinase XerD